MLVTDHDLVPVFPDSAINQHHHVILSLAKEMAKAKAERALRCLAVLRETYNLFLDHIILEESLFSSIPYRTYAFHINQHLMLHHNILKYLYFLQKQPACDKFFDDNDAILSDLLADIRRDIFVMDDELLHILKDEGVVTS